MAISVRQRYRAVLWSVLTIVLAVTGTDAQPTVTVTMRLAEAGWHVVRQEVLPRFESACNCRVRAIDVPPETLVQRLRAMHQAGRMEVDLFAQDNMRLQELINTALASPFTPEESQVEEAIYPSLMAVGVSGGVRYFLPFRPMCRPSTTMLRSSRNTNSSRRGPGQNSSPWPARSMKKSRQVACCSPAPAGHLRPHSSTSGLLQLEATRLTSHIQGQWIPSVF
jgi:hypothetical protein